MIVATRGDLGQISSRVQSSQSPDRVTRIVLDGTDGPVGNVFGVRYERAG